MSKPNLPPLVGRSPDEFAFSSELVTVDEAKSYAEEAVRQALAAQETRAWLIRERKNGTDPMFTIATTTEPFESLYWPLAIIPENDHG